MRFLSIIWIFFFVIAFVDNGRGQWIQKIVPAETKLLDVEKLLGKSPKSTRDDQAFFELPEGNLFLGLSLGECKRTTWGSWDLEKDVVIYLIFYPKKKVKPARYGLSSAGMTEGMDSGHKTFTNPVDGFYFATQFGRVTSIHYFPSKKYANHRCDGGQ